MIHAIALACRKYTKLEGNSDFKKRVSVKRLEYNIAKKEAEEVAKNNRLGKKRKKKSGRTRFTHIKGIRRGDHRLFNDIVPVTAEK